MRKLFLIFSLTFALLPVSAGNMLAAVGCDLNDPDRDVRRLFPDSTGYRTTYLSIDRIGGQPLFERLQDRLGDRFTGLFETIDVPYTLYTVLKGRDVIGYIHGVNERGQHGGMQVFLVLDTKGAINDFYMQRITSREASTLRSRDFGAQFSGLSLADFVPYNPVRRADIPGAIQPREGDDFFSVLRAVKKNLILMDIFVFSNKETAK